MASTYKTVLHYEPLGGGCVTSYAGHCDKEYNNLTQLFEDIERMVQVHYSKACCIEVKRDDKTVFYVHKPSFALDYHPMFNPIEEFVFIPTANLSTAEKEYIKQKKYSLIS